METNCKHKVKEGSYIRCGIDNSLRKDGKGCPCARITPRQSLSDKIKKIFGKKK